MTFSKSPRKFRSFIGAQLLLYRAMCHYLVILFSYWTSFAMCSGGRDRSVNYRVSLAGSKYFFLPLRYLKQYLLIMIVVAPYVIVAIAY